MQTFHVKPTATGCYGDSPSTAIDAARAGVLPAEPGFEDFYKRPSDGVTSGYLSKAPTRAWKTMPLMGHPGGTGVYFGGSFPFIHAGLSPADQAAADAASAAGIGQAMAAANSSTPFPMPDPSNPAPIIPGTTGAPAKDNTSTYLIAGGVAVVGFGLYLALVSPKRRRAYA